MKNTDIESFLEQLRQAGWTVKERDDAAVSLNPAFLERYPAIPEDYAGFLAITSLCVNPTEMAWFLCEDDYNEVAGSAFKWNEFEIQSLDAAEGDDALTTKVRAFWNTHLPILMSVKSGYSYIAISLSRDSFGTVVFGREPEYEEPDTVCESFSKLVDLIGDAIATGTIWPPLDEIL